MQAGFTEAKLHQPSTFTDFTYVHCLVICSKGEKIPIDSNNLKTTRISITGMAMY